MACYEACRCADNPLAIPVVTELEVQYYLTLRDYFITVWDYFIQTYWILCLSCGILAGETWTLTEPEVQEPGAPSWAGCTPESLICNGTTLKRGDSRTVGNKKAFRCNVAKWRISTNQHQTTRRAENLPSNLLWRPKRVAVAYYNNLAERLCSVSADCLSPSGAVSVPGNLLSVALWDQYADFSLSAQLLVGNSRVGATQQFDYVIWSALSLTAITATNLSRPDM